MIDGDLDITDNTNLVAKLYMRKQSTYTENSNKAHGNGIIDPENFSPYPKNSTIIPLVSDTSDQASDQADEDIKRLLQYCKIPRSREEMQQFMGLSHRGYLLQYNGSILILKGVYYCEMERSYKRLS